MKKVNKIKETVNSGADFFIIVTFVPSVILAIVKLEWGIDISWAIVFFPIISIVSLVILVPLYFELSNSIKRLFNKKE